MSINSKYISIQIDGATYRVPGSMTILEAARKKNIYIPTLCYLENLTPYGGCRLCVVEVSDMHGFQTSCTTPVAKGMQIKTKSKKLNKIRREILELILSEHPFTCLTCKDKNDCSEFMHSTRKVSTITGCNFCTSNGDCELQDLFEYLKMGELKFPMYYRGLEPERNNPFYDLDYNLCILCGRCVRICNEERLSNVLAFVQRGNDTIVGTAFNESQQDAGCEYCGACVDVCPTGSISEKLGKWAGLPDKSIQTSCIFCSVGCDMNVNTRKNRIVNVGPKPGERIHPPQICVRGKFVPEDLVHHPDRIQTPMIRKGDKWVEVDMNEALSYTASQFKLYKEKSFGIIGTAHDSMEDQYLLQKFARRIMLTNNTDLYSSYPSGELLEAIHRYQNSFGVCEIENILEADTLVIVGADGSVSHPIIENKIRKAYRQNATVVYANPMKSRTTEFSNTTLCYSAGTEQLLLTTLVAGLLDQKNGEKYRTLKEGLNGFDTNKAVRSMGLYTDQISKILKLLLKSKQAIFIVGDSLLRNAGAMESFNALVNIQLLLGPSRCKGIIFLLSEGNLYGGTLAGLHPNYLPGFVFIRNDKGISSAEMLDKINSNSISSLFISGDVPADPKYLNLKFLVQHNMFLTETSKYAHVFFPAKSFMEAEATFLDIDRNVKKTRPVTRAPGSSKTSGEVISAIATAMQEEDFRYKNIKEQTREMMSNIDLSFKSGQKLVKSFRPFSWKYPVSNKEKPVKVFINYNHYHYRGNILSELIDDMKKFSGKIEKC